MPTFQLVSDIHLELNFEVPVLPVTADNLVLCGDIGLPGKRYYSFLREVSSRYGHVIVILGNHEYYARTTIDLARLPANVHVLDKASVEIDGVTVLGATLWSDVTDSAFAGLADGRRIWQFTAEKSRALHRTHVAWLASAIAATPGPVLVATHHAPVLAANGALYADSPLKTAFATDLHHLFHPNVRAWCWGHTHVCYDDEIGGTRLLANCFGYANEHTGFDPSLNFTIK